MLTAARQALDEAGGQALLPVEVDDAGLLAWVRATLERMRERGSIEHEWLKKLVEEDGNRYFIWRGRPKSQGMPAFPLQRTAPAFPRIGAASKVKENVLDPVSTPQSWYAQWTARALGVTAAEGATLARLLLKRLAANNVLTVTSNKGGAEVFGISQGSVVVGPIEDEDLVSGRHLLVCRVCQGQVPGTRTVVDQLDGAPCVVTRCTGRLERTPGDPANFYRRFFGAKQVQRVIAREHSSLLDDDLRLQYENGFKGRADDPSAPNVLVATPTLEMGIDIGDLSTVMLASLPRTVASYLQRVGRAGRLTGSALDLAFVSGRGEQLPRLGQPTSMINGRVRPPATYLDAEEILRRQFLASLADRQARAEDGVHPELPTGAIGSVDPDSYLHAIAVDGESGGHLEEFLASFSTLSKESQSALREWASPAGDTDLTSPLAARLLAESQRWRHRVETLGHRIVAIEASIPELERLAALPVASDDDKARLPQRSSILAPGQAPASRAPDGPLGLGAGRGRHPAQLHAPRRLGHPRRRSVLAGPRLGGVRDRELVVPPQRGARTSRAGPRGDLLCGWQPDQGEHRRPGQPRRGGTHLGVLPGVRLQPRCHRGNVDSDVLPALWKPGCGRRRAAPGGGRADQGVVLDEA